ncbi:hypothetical protein ACET3Z_013496 [Daucus carota]
MEIRSPRLEANRKMTRDQLEDDDAFVTPREQFSNSGRKETEQSGRKMGSYVLPRKARGQMASSGKKMQSQLTTLRHDAAAVANQKKAKVGSSTPKISEMSQLMHPSIMQTSHWLNAYAFSATLAAFLAHRVGQQAKRTAPQ